MSQKRALRRTGLLFKGGREGPPSQTNRPRKFARDNSLPAEFFISLDLQHRSLSAKCLHNSIFRQSKIVDNLVENCRQYFINCIQSYPKMYTIKFLENGQKIRKVMYDYIRNISTVLKRRTRTEVRERKVIIMRIILDLVRNRVTVVLLLVLALVAVTAVSPAEGAFATRRMTISCDGLTVQTGTSVRHRGGTGVAIQQLTSTPDSSTWVWMTRRTGNGLYPQLVSDGDWAIWKEDVARGHWSVKAVRDGSSNCNGGSFGHGNYTIWYTVSYRG